MAVPGGVVTRSSRSLTKTGALSHPKVQHDPVATAPGSDTSSRLQLVIGDGKDCQWRAPLEQKAPEEQDAQNDEDGDDDDFY